MIDIIFHYPPELLNLLVDTIPLLFRSKQDVLLFFKGAGVSSAVIVDIAAKLKADRNSVNKYEITRTVLARLNERGESSLRERREILKRVTEFEDYSTCWPEDQLKAKGLVSEIRRVIDVKDSFTRMNIERETELKRHQAEQMNKLEEMQRRKTQLSDLQRRLFSLFSESNSQKRGKDAEAILNELFAVNGISVREAFTLSGVEGEGIVEQIDGVVELDGSVYLAEMKWHKDPIGTPDVSQHLVRVFNRGYARGIFISASGYTEPAVTVCRDSLQKTVIVLCTLEEIVNVLEREGNFTDLLKAKIRAAIIDKNPLFTE